MIKNPVPILGLPVLKIGKKIVGGYSDVATIVTRKYGGHVLPRHKPLTYSEKCKFVGKNRRKF